MVSKAAEISKDTKTAADPLAQILRRLSVMYKSAVSVK